MADDDAPHPGPSLPSYPHYDGRRYQLERPGKATRTLIPLADVAGVIDLGYVALRNYLRDHTHLPLEKLTFREADRPEPRVTLLVLDEYDLPALYHSLPGAPRRRPSAGSLPTLPRPA